MKEPHRFQEEIDAIIKRVRAEKAQGIKKARRQQYEFVLRFAGRHRNFYIGDKTEYVSMLSYSYGTLHYSEDPSSWKYFPTATKAVEFKHTLMDGIEVEVAWVYARPWSKQSSKIKPSDQTTDPQ